MQVNEITEAIIGAAIEVHRTLGAGLLESAYEECLCRELTLRGIGYERQVALPVLYKGAKLDCGYRLDIVVESLVIVEIKALDQLLPIHDAQLLTYLRLSGKQVGLLVNFNVPVLKAGLKRMVNGFADALSASSAPLR
jgi:GxxExxY protein